jgi:thiamine-phosphate pyrophosphorylase
LPLREKAAGLLAGGARVVQPRMKRTPLREVVAACRRAGAVCLVNDRVDPPLLSGAHGVHVGDEDLPAEEARALLGPEALVGVAVASDVLLAEDIAERVRRLSAAFDRGAQGASLVGGDV